MKLLLVALILFCAHENVFAHGGVVMEEDACVIKIGYLRAHFTLYQPTSRGNEEFCEDVPDVVPSVFVLDYLHDFLKEMPVDFRIIKDVKGFGEFTNWDDVQSIEDLEAATVFYQSAVTMPQGMFTVDYDFHKAGGYIGIVTATHPTTDKTYNAVFFFRVGGRDWGYLPIIILLLVFVQTFYWISTGGLDRWIKPSAV